MKSFATLVILSCFTATVFAGCLNPLVSGAKVIILSTQTLILIRDPTTNVNGTMKTHVVSTLPSITIPMVVKSKKDAWTNLPYTLAVFLALLMPPTGSLSPK